MPANIQVILQSKITTLGDSGELVKVRPGYARNFLIPRGLAVPATTAQVNRINHERAVALAKAEKAKKEAEATAAKIGGLSVKIARPVGEDDKLFGSVTSKDIEAAVKSQGVAIDRKKMHLPEAIRHLGTFEIPVKLHSDVTATLKVEVVKA